MASVWEGRFAQFVRSITALRESTALELLPDLMPVLPVIGDGAEHALLRRERLVHGGKAQASVAGRYCKYQVHNTSTNMLLVIDELRAWSGAGQPAVFYLTNLIAGYADSAAVYVRDGRAAGIATALRVKYLTDAAAPAVSEPQVYIATGSSAGGISPMREGWVIPPGMALFVGMTVANTALSLWVSGRERTVDPVEFAGTGA